MRSEISIEEYDRLSDRVRLSWRHLNQAGDTPDSHRSLLSLQSALDEILAVDAALRGSSSVDSAVERHHHGLLNSQLDAPDVLRQLAGRAQEIRRNPKAPYENVPDALLAHSAIPILWRMLRDIRREVRSHRARPYYVRLAGRLARGAAALATLWAALHLAWFALPWGCLVTYASPGDPTAVRGWSVATSLVADHGTGRPLPWMRREGWTACWQGVLLVPESAEYSFFAQCAGGMRLWIDEDLLVDNWTSAGWVQGAQHAQLALTQGPHALRMEFRGRGGRAALRVRWTGGPIPPNTDVGFPYLRKY